VVSSDRSFFWGPLRLAADTLSIMIPRGKDWFHHVLIVALCLAAVLIWTAAGTIFDRPALDETAQTDD
jgi:hypothetical protein